MINISKTHFTHSWWAHDHRQYHRASMLHCYKPQPFRYLWMDLGFMIDFSSVCGLTCVTIHTHDVSSRINKYEAQKKGKVFFSILLWISGGKSGSVVVAKHSGASNEPSKQISIVTDRTVGECRLVCAKFQPELCFWAINGGGGAGNCLWVRASHVKVVNNLWSWVNYKPFGANLSFNRVWLWTFRYWQPALHKKCGGRWGSF